MANFTLAFDKLPAEVRQKLIDLQTTGPDRFAFIPSLSKLYRVAIAAGLGWSAYMFLATENYLWTDWMYWLFAGGSLLFITLALYSIFKIVSTKLTKLKDGYVFTTDELIRTRGNWVQFWSLRELEGFQFREDIKTIEVWIGERVEKIRAENIDEAQKLEQIFVEWRNNAGEGFLKDWVKPETAYNGSMKTAATLAGLIVLLAISFGASLAARTMNRNYDDARTWKRLENGTTVADFEEYKQRHPSGLYVVEADRKMADIFGKLKDDYAKKVKNTADETAVKALSEVLENSGKIANRTVYVRIRETRELDDAVVKKVRQMTGYPVQTYDYSVPPGEEPFRKGKLADDLGLVFLPATRSASINFELNDNPPPNTTTLDINYFARSMEGFYRFYWSSNGSMTTFYNPAVKFEFDLTLKSPDARELYKTNYISTYTNLGNSGLFDMRDAANYSFDKMYFSAVSDDFSKYLGRQFGFIE